MDDADFRDPRNLAPYLRFMVQHQASDLFLSVGSPPAVKIDGMVRALKLPPLSSMQSKALAYSVMRESQIREFESTLECDLATNFDGLGRFRFNVFQQRGEVSMVARYISDRIPSLEALNLPVHLRELAMVKRGLVLIVGAAGSGKSTTLASMLDWRNRNSPGHILTVEDPIEFVHTHQQSIVDQREVGLDTHSFAEALRHAMREAPDVILIGEIRDELTMRHALAYAETGHLCLSTLHANNANQAIDRVLNFFPEAARHQALLDLSLNLRGVVAQRLVPGLDGGRVPAVEILLHSPHVADLIAKGEIEQLKEAIGHSNEAGMQTFDQSLYALYRAGRIGLDAALENADSRTDLSLRIRLTSGDLPDASGLEIR